MVFYLGVGFFLAAVVVIAAMIRGKPDNLIEGDEHVEAVPVAV